MNTKTPGQIARHEYYSENGTWDSAAAAVIAHHEAQKAQPKFKVGDRIRRVSYDNRCAPLGHEVIVLSDYTYIDLEGDSIVIDDSCWEKVEWALPAPPPGRATIKLLIPIKLNHGNFSFASK